MRILERIALGVIAIIVLAVVVLYAGSEWKMRRGHDVALAPIAVPRDAASIAEGARLAKITGCRDCHGANGGGGRAGLKDPMVGTIARAGPCAMSPRATAMPNCSARSATAYGATAVHCSSCRPMPTPIWLTTIPARIIAWIRTLKPLPGDSRRDDESTDRSARALVAGRQDAARASILPTVSVADAAGRYRQVFRQCLLCRAATKLHEPGQSHDGKQTVPALAPDCRGL